MDALKKYVSRMERRFDAAMEAFLFHHRLLGFLMVFIGMPLLTLVAVCTCTTVVALPIAVAFGWV